MKPHAAPLFGSPGSSSTAATPGTARTSRSLRTSRTPRANAGSTSASNASSSAAAAAAQKVVFASSPVPFFTLTAASSLPSLLGSSAAAAHSHSVYATPQSDYRPLYGKPAESIKMRRVDDQPAVWKADESDDDEERLSVASLRAINRRNKKQLRRQQKDDGEHRDDRRQHDGAQLQSGEKNEKDERASVPIAMEGEDEASIVCRLPARERSVKPSSRALVSAGREQMAAESESAVARSGRRSRPTSSSHSRQHRPHSAALLKAGAQTTAAEDDKKRREDTDPAAGAAAGQRLPASATDGSTQRQLTRRQRQAAVSDDDDEEDEDEAGSGDDDEYDDDSDDEEERDNSDAEYVDDAIDDNSYFIDPPSPIAASISQQPQHFSFVTRPTSASTANAANNPPSPSLSSSPLTIEMVAHVLYSVFSPPSLLQQLSSGPQLSPTSSSAAANLLGSPIADSSSTSSSSLSPPLYPALPELSRATALLLGLGLTVSASQHLMALLLLYSVCWHDIVSALRRDMSDSVARERKDGVLARVWRLFHFALTAADMYEPTAEELEMGEMRDDRRTLPEMRLTVDERRRQQRKAEMASKRTERLDALRHRESHAADRVMHHHRQLLALSAEKVKAEEERKRLESDVELERAKQRQRNEEKAKRLLLFDELKRRMRVAREKQRMMEEDRAAMDRHMQTAQSNSNQLHAQLKTQRADNEQLSKQLRQVTDSMHALQQQSATFQQRDMDGRRQETDGRREEDEGKQRESVERGRASDLHERMVYDVVKRLRVVREVRQWTEATLSNETAAAELVGDVERTTEQKAEMEEEIEQMKETHVEMQQNIVTEKANQVRLNAEVARNIRRVDEEEDVLLHLQAQLQAVDVSRAVQQSQLNNVVALYNEAQAQLQHDQTHIAITIQHIETLNTDSVAIDRHNYARMKEARQMDKSKAAMEMDRGAKRTRVERFEDNKTKLVWEKEQRNSDKERECVEWMRLVKQRQAEIEAVAVRERQLIQLQNDKLDLYDRLLLEGQQSRDERLRLLDAVEEAKEEVLQLREKQSKVAAIQQNEDSLLVSLQAAHDTQLEAKRAEIEQLKADADGVQQQLMAVRGELSEAAVKRAAMEADQQAVMAGMQDRLTAVVKEGAAHDDEMKAWMLQQRDEREAVTKESEQWKRAAEGALNEQQRLRKEVEAVRAKVREQKAQQAELRMQHAIVTQNNNTATSEPRPITACTCLTASAVRA